MADIAKEAGVAKSTVSRFFNGGYVKEETRQKLQKIVKAHNYEPSAAAANLKLNQTKTIGVIAPTLISIVSSRMLMELDKSLKKHGYNVIIVNTDHDVNEEIRAIHYLTSLRVDGIVLVATNVKLLHQRLVHESAIPILIVGQQYPAGPSIIYDDYRAGYEAGSYAAAMGHDNVLYLGVGRVDEAVGVQRKKGVMDALSDKGVGHIHFRETSFSYTQAMKTVHKYLEDHSPTLIIAATDSLALAAMKEVLNKGLRVPEDVSIMGFGGYETSSLVTPALATIRFDNELAGKLAASTILAMIQKEPVANTQLVGYSFQPGASVISRKKEDD